MEEKTDLLDAERLEELFLLLLGPEEERDEAAAEVITAQSKLPVSSDPQPEGRATRRAFLVLSNSSTQRSRSVFPIH